MNVKSIDKVLIACPRLSPLALSLYQRGESSRFEAKFVDAHDDVAHFRVPFFPRVDWIAETKRAGKFMVRVDRLGDF